MNTGIGIAYDKDLRESSIISFPPELPFKERVDELSNVNIEDCDKSRLEEIASEQGIFKRCEMIMDFLSISENPGALIQYVASLAGVKETPGVILLYTMLSAIPPVDEIVSEYVEFKNMKKYMKMLEQKESEGKGLSESEIWFRKKVETLSVSHPLPEAAEANEPWRQWETGVRKAVADPDDRWNSSILERIKTELEAKRQRLISLAASIDPEAHPRLITWMANENGEIKWLKEMLEMNGAGSDGSGLIIRRRLENQWKSMTEFLKQSESGKLLVELFEAQAQKSHSYNQIKLGTAVLRAVFMHPILSRSSKDIDLLSCLYLYVNSSYKGEIKMMLPSKKIERELLSVPGFSIEEDLVKIDQGMVYSGYFLRDDDLPADFDWTDFSISTYGNFKSLILSQIDNDTFLNQILSNPKITGKPGVVSLIAMRCRSSSVLSTIANRRELYTGFANKDVPLHLIMNPAKISVSSLRKFMHVRYIDKMTLTQLSSRRGKGGQIREEVRREIKRYVDSR